MDENSQSREPLGGVGLDLDEVNQERQRVLVVEDEPDTVYLLKQILRIAGFNVLSASNGIEALHKVAEFHPDLVLLDLMMPEMDGWQTIDVLRQMGETPVIVISAVGGKNEVVQGLRLGADDYVTKPFHNAEVIARVKAVLRRTGRSKEVNHIVFPHIGLSMDLKNKQVTVNHRAIQLTSREFEVLATLAKKAPSAVDYRTISNDVWGEDTPGTRNRTKYLVYLLRKKIKMVGADPDVIVNVDRLGYRLDSEKE